MVEQIWSCKIGADIPDELPPGSDHPMRIAVETAFRSITGVDANFNFSGWAGTLDESQRAVVENREPKPTPSTPTTGTQGWGRPTHARKYHYFVNGRAFNGAHANAPPPKPWSSCPKDPPASSIASEVSHDRP